MRSSTAPWPQNKAWQPQGSWVVRYGVIFEDFKSPFHAQLFGFANVAKMLAVGVLIGVLSEDEDADYQASLLLWVGSLSFVLMLIYRPFCSMQDNAINLVAELSGFLPLVIAVYGAIDPATCELAAGLQNAMTISAFLGILAQFAALAQEFLPTVYGAVVWLVFKTTAIFK